MNFYNAYKIFPEVFGVLISVISIYFQCTTFHFLVVEEKQSKWANSKNMQFAFIIETG